MSWSSYRSIPTTAMESVVEQHSLSSVLSSSSPPQNHSCPEISLDTPEVGSCLLVTLDLPMINSLDIAWKPLSRLGNNSPMCLRARRGRGLPEKRRNRHSSCFCEPRIRFLSSHLWQLILVFPLIVRLTLNSYYYSFCRVSQGTKDLPRRQENIWTAWKLYYH